MLPSSISPPYKKAAFQGIELNAEWRVQKPDGSERWLMSRGQPKLDAQGQPVGYIGIVMDINRHKKAEAEIIRQKEELRGLAARLAEVEEAERQQLARELHDQVCQNLASINISLETLMIRAQREPLDQLLSRLAEVGAVAEQTGEITRDIMEGLRPTVLDHYGLMGGLRQFGSQFSQRTGINLEILGEDADSPLKPNVELALFRIAQDAVGECRDRVERALANLASDTTESRVRACDFPRRLRGH